MNNRICTLYYNTEIDPQMLRRTPPDCYTYIRPWYESVMKMNLKGVIFYDNLSESFLKDYGNDNIEFIPFDPAGYSSRFKYSLLGFNDGRFPLYYDYLLKTPLDNVVFTDCYDAWLNMDIFAQMEKTGANLFCGSERTNFIGNKWLKKKFDVFACSNCNAVYRWYIANQKQTSLNAGILGGTRDNVLKFLHDATELHTELELDRKEKYNLNMAVFNYVFYNLNLPFTTGYPVHNLYKQRDKRTDVWITHK